jgi:hypothetical protein
MSIFLLVFDNVSVDENLSSEDHISDETRKFDDVSCK